MTVATKQAAVQHGDQNDFKHTQTHGPKATKNPDELVAQLVAAQRTAQQDAEKKHLDHAAAALLRLEGDLRRVSTFTELAHFVANEPRALLGAQQVCVMEKNRRDRFIAKAVSSISIVDRSAPVVHWFERVLYHLAQSHEISDLIAFDANAFGLSLSDHPESFRLGSLIWVPFVECDGVVRAGMMLARTAPWTDKDKAVAGFIGRAISHTWQAHRGIGRQFQSFSVMTPKRVALAGAVVVALGLLPVSMTALAPVEVVARNPFIVTTSVAGVVEDVVVAPNARVDKGDVLATLNDTAFRNAYDLSVREVQVAEARYKKAAQLAFLDSRGRQEIGVTHAELQVKLAERTYAKAMLERTKIKAGSAGVATFTSATDLIGVPLKVGEKLMEIASPEQFEFRIHLPVSDAIVLKPHARVKIFLDSDPLNPVEAQLVRADYRAKRTKTDTMAFRLVARRLDDTQPAVRLGVRGTAQVYSDHVTLAFYLFRRPLGVVRQWAGI